MYRAVTQIWSPPRYRLGSCTAMLDLHPEGAHFELRDALMEDHTGTTGIPRTKTEQHFIMTSPYNRYVNRRMWPYSKFYAA